MTDTILSPEVAEPIAPRRRWLKILGLLLLALVLLVALAPCWTAPIVRGMVVSGINDQIDGTLAVEDFSWSWGGKVHMEGVRLVDDAGQPVASVEVVDASVEPMPALSGDIRAAVTVSGLQADLRRTPDGRINVEAIAPKQESQPKTERQETLPKVAATARIHDATVRVHGPDGQTVLRDVELAYDQVALDQPATFAVSAQVEGPAGPAGALNAQGDVLLAPGGNLDAGPQARVDYTLDGLRVEGLAPAAALFAPMPATAGVVQGTGHWEWKGGLAVSGQTELSLAGLKLAGQPGQPPVPVPDMRLTAEAALDDQGAGRQTVALLAPPLLELRWDGTTTGLLGDRPALAGTLTAQGQLGELLGLAREHLALQPGADVSGALTLQSELAVQLSPEGPESLSVQASLDLQDAVARDAQGRPLDLGGLDALSARLRLEAQPLAGRAALEHFELKAGPVQASAAGRIEGLPREGEALDPAALAVQGGQFSVDADLAALVAAVAPLADLKGMKAQGSLTARGTADGSAGAVTGRANLAVKDLAVQGADGLDLSLPALTADVGASADARAIHVQQLTLRWEPLRAMTHDVPAGELTAQASWFSQEGALDVPQWTLSCPLVSGQGRAKVSGLGDPAARRIEAQAKLGGDVEAGRAWMVALMPELQPARGEGRWELELTADASGEKLSARPQLTLRDVALHGYVVGGRELPLEQADVDLVARLEIDRAGGGSLRAEELSLKAPGVELSATGQAAGFQPDAAAARGQLQCTWTLNPDVVNARLGALLGGIGLGGAPLSGAARVELSPTALAASGDLKGAELAVTLPADPDTEKPARTLVQRELAAAFDLTAAPWPSPDSVEIRRAEYRSSTAQLSAKGRVAGLDTPAATSADITWRLDAELSTVLADLGPALGLPPWEARGQAGIEGALKGDAGQLALVADGTIANLHMVVPVKAPAKAGAAGAVATPGAPAATGAKQPIVIDEQALTFGLTADILMEPLDVALGRAAISSSFLRGQASGKIQSLRSGQPRLAPLEGDFTYIPDTLGALLSPWLPVEWSGAEEQPLRFRVEGALADVDPVALLSGISADATVGLGQVTVPGLTTGGQIEVENQAGRTHVTGKLTANDGTLDVDADLDLRAAAAVQSAGAAAGAAAAAGFGSSAPSRFDVKLAGLQVTQELADLLGHVSPLFSGRQLATVKGQLSADVNGNWNGPLPVGEPAGGWLAAVSKSLTASGRLDAGKLDISSSPFLGELLAAVNLPVSTNLSLSPLDFQIKDGRLAYAQPWVLKLAGVDTNFTGSVGLDQTLDLQWNVPVTEQLVEKHGFLDSLKGQAISIPITGTAKAPSLRWSDALRDLAESAAKAGLDKTLKDKLGSLPPILGGGDEDDGAQPGLSAEDLLAKADKLWDEGKQAEAKPLYQELIDKHKLTLVYALNKKRIKDRAE